jgi:hypothetical protein
MKSEDSASLRLAVPTSIASHSSIDLHSPPSNSTIHNEISRPCYFLMINGGGIHYNIVAPDTFTSSNIYANYAALKEKETSVGNNKRNRKNAELLTHKILETIAPIVSPNISVQKLLLKPLNELSQSNLLSSGPILFVVESSLSPIRHFNSFLMSLKGSNSSSGTTGPATAQPKQELEGYFTSSQYSGAQKKLLRSILSGLLSLCLAPNEPVNSSNAKQLTKPKSGKGATVVTATSGTSGGDSTAVNSSNSSNSQAKKGIVYMYSVLDDGLDLLSIDTNILLMLR